MIENDFHSSDRVKEVSVLLEGGVFSGTYSIYENYNSTH